MSVLITGGSGLLGSKIKIDNALKPSRKELNLLDYCELKKFIQFNNINKIVHCAAMVGGVKTNKDKVHDFFNENLKINMNIIEACKEFNLQNSIFILSTCIMPEKAELPYTEQQLHMGEPHPSNYGYAYAKRMLEVGSRSLKEQYNINTNCLIPCNLYGTNDNYNLETGHVIPSLIHKCYLAKINNKPFEVWGSGNPLREFMYVNDFARVIEKIHNEHIDAPLMIVSFGQTYSIRQLVEMIAKYMEFNGEIIYDTSKPDGIFKKPTCPNLFNKHFSKFSWTPLEYGLKETIKHFVESYPNIRL